jgi:hypothetical protein
MDLDLTEADMIVAAHETGHVLVAAVEGWGIGDATMIGSPLQDGLANLTPQPLWRYRQCEKGSFVPRRFLPKRWALWPQLRVALAGIAGVKEAIKSASIQLYGDGGETDMRVAQHALTTCRVDPSKWEAILAEREMEARRFLYELRTIHEQLIRALLDAFPSNRSLSAHSIIALIESHEDWQPEVRRRKS